MARTMWHVSVQTVGAMLHHKPKLKMQCSRCNGYFKVPLRLLAKAYGPDFSLINKRIGCPSHGCGGSCVILHSNGGGSPFLRLGG